MRSEKLTQNPLKISKLSQCFDVSNEIKSHFPPSEAFLKTILSESMEEECRSVLEYYQQEQAYYRTNESEIFFMKYDLLHTGRKTKSDPH